VFQESEFQTAGYFFSDIIFCSSRRGQTGFRIVVKRERLRLDLRSLPGVAANGERRSVARFQLSHFFCGFQLRCQAPLIDHSAPGHELGNHMVIDAPAHKLTESEFESGTDVVGSAIFQPDRVHHCA
jgi:hypothetical protein